MQIIGPHPLSACYNHCWRWLMGPEDKGNGIITINDNHNNPQSRPRLDPVWPLSDSLLIFDRIIWQQKVLKKLQRYNCKSLQEIILHLQIENKSELLCAPFIFASFSSKSEYWFFHKTLEACLWLFVSSYQVDYLSSYCVMLSVFRQ